jgi:hypothetical protein
MLRARKCVDKEDLKHTILRGNGGLKTCYEALRHATSEETCRQEGGQLQSNIKGVCVRERERERERKREKEKERERARERLCVRVCVREREGGSYIGRMGEGGRGRECVRPSVCACVCSHIHTQNRTLTEPHVTHIN